MTLKETVTSNSPCMSGNTEYVKQRLTQVPLAD